MTKKSSKSRRKKQAKQRSQRVFYGLLIVAAVIGVGVFFATRPGGSLSSTLSFPDIHGMSFSGDGKQFIVATHTGLNVYENGRWTAPDYPKNDYMGYTGVEDGFYASGHPGTGSRLPNPIGLVKSDDFGRTIDTLGFGGQIDFHTTAASYRTDTLYVVNPQATGAMDAGLHFSTDGGATWQSSATSGLTRGIIQLAAHPDEPGTVAVASQSGLFLSTDFGNTFEPIMSGIVTSAAFDLANPDNILFGFNQLSIYNTQDQETLDLFTPELTDSNDGLMLIAINPESVEVAAATFSRNVYLSDASRDQWNLIVRDGMSTN